DEALARLERIGIALAADLELGAVAADLLDLRGRGDHGNENRGAHAELHRRIRDRRAVVAARCRDDARLRQAAREQAVERAARLERSGVLQVLELEDE